MSFNMGMVMCLAIFCRQKGLFADINLSPLNVLFCAPVGR